jgi:uncharacterized repeat protein (TIGR03803 family)
MTLWNAIRCTLTICVAAALGACNGTQPLISVPPGSSSTALGAAQKHTTSSYAVLYNFSGGSADGAAPVAPLLNVNGTLYGTTQAGGGSGCSGTGCGTVFSITTSGAETVLHNFGGSGDGADPVAGLLAVNGILYGTTYLGGAHRCDGDGCGTVFSITTGGTEKVLRSLELRSRYHNGTFPQAGLIDVGGKLYGTTTAGSLYRSGTVFRMTLRGAEKTLYNFTYSTGYSKAALVDARDILYGTTVNGGSYREGSVFTIKRDGTENVLHSFSGPDGEDPDASLADVNGTLYGVTPTGGEEIRGTVFSITSSGTVRVLHSFGSKHHPHDGTQPAGALLSVNGTLYGVTYAGGTSGYGTVFSVTRSGKETVLHSFAGAPYDGANPQAGLIDVNGTLYGTTAGGGTNSDGTVFALSP